MQPVVSFTDLHDGSFAPVEAAARLETRRRAITPHPVTWLTQVHGSGVVTVDVPGDGCGVRADAAVTTRAGAALCVITADCAPVLLSSEVAVAAVHAGWRGLVAGVLEETVSVMRAVGATSISASLGPCIRSRCYEFGSIDLAVAIDAFGPGVAAQTAWGAPALDVTTAVRTALEHLGVHGLVDSGVCTACSPNHWSHRARGDAGRQAAFIWLER